jgi:type I restriction enzyme S subunit
MSLMSEFKIGITVREVAFGQDCKALIPNQGIDPFFLAYAIKAQTPTILNLVDAAGHGTGRLQTDRIAALKIPIPTNQSEQVQVASMVKSLDNKIAVNDRIAGTVDSLLKASYVAISQSTRQEVRLGRLIELKYGKALREENRIPGQIPVFGGNGISGSHNVPLNGGPGIIVGRKGANAGSVSWSQGPFWAIDTSFYVELRSEAIPLEFLLFLLEDAGLRNLVGDSAIPGLNREIALSLTVRVPADDVVQLFAETARPLLALNEQITQESRSVAELRNTLLPKLMSGEIRVRDAEKVVEDVT